MGQPKVTLSFVRSAMLPAATQLQGWVGVIFYMSFSIPIIANDMQLLLLQWYCAVPYEDTKDK
jgi:hypothetical protein